MITFHTRQYVLLIQGAPAFSFVFNSLQRALVAATTSPQVHVVVAGVILAGLVMVKQMMYLFLGLFPLSLEELFKKWLVVIRIPL
jgi:hypothetical protein